MSRKRKVHSAEFKAKVAMEAAKWVRTLSELSSMFKVHPTVISNWRRQWLKGGRVYSVKDSGSTFVSTIRSVLILRTATGLLGRCT